MTTKSWGPHVWTFIHTFCERIKDDFFAINKKRIIGSLFMICSNVPCPYCAEHAKTYLKSVDTRKITSKALLKKFFFDFHNNVNKNTKKPIFDNFDKYKNYSVPNTYRNFKRVFLQNYYLRDKFHLTMRRKTLCKNIDRIIVQQNFI